jgi:hypothetical protein
MATKCTLAERVAATTAKKKSATKKSEDRRQKTEASGPTLEERLDRAGRAQNAPVAPPAPARGTRMSGIDLKNLLRQQRRAARFEERGY